MLFAGAARPRGSPYIPWSPSPYQAVIDPAPTTSGLIHDSEIHHLVARFAISYDGSPCSKFVGR